MSTLYQVLGLPRGANQQQVKAAFRTLARRFHPDLNAGDEPPSSASKRSTTLTRLWPIQERGQRTIAPWCAG